MKTSSPRIGVLGGSFNPPHFGHLLIASEAAWQLSLQRVLFVPAADPPHKRIDGGANAALRLRMTRTAVAGDERFDVEPVEIERGLRFTVDTLGALKEALPAADLWFIVGSDSLLAFRTWRNPAGILRLCRVAVALRPGDDRTRVAAAAGEYGDRVVVLASVGVAISSTEIRERVRRGRPIRYLVPPAVEGLIVSTGLYREPGFLAGEPS